jgi:hypothetical protein
VFSGTEGWGVWSSGGGALGPADDGLGVMSSAYHVPMRQEFDGALSPTPHYYEIKGRAAEIARACSASPPRGGPGRAGGAVLLCADPAVA